MLLKLDPERVDAALHVGAISNTGLHERVDAADQLHEFPVVTHYQRPEVCGFRIP